MPMREGKIILRRQLGLCFTVKKINVVLFYLIYNKMQ